MHYLLHLLVVKTLKFYNTRYLIIIIKTVHSHMLILRCNIIEKGVFTPYKVKRIVLDGVLFSYFKIK